MSLTLAQQPTTARATHLRVFGMRRSGNHAVIDWLRRNLGVDSLFMNDCRPGDPLDSFQYIELGDLKRGTPFRNKGKGAEKLKSTRGDWAAHVVSYEDQPPPARLGRLTRGYGRETTWHNIVIHRSFANWLASFYRLVTIDEAGTPRGFDGPVQVAGALDAYRRMADTIASLPDAFTTVRFDDWARDDAYRAALLEQIGLQNLDNSTGQQSEYGGGSSFEKGDQRPTDDALSQRWRAMCDNSGFRAVVAIARADDAFCNSIETVEPGATATLDQILNTPTGPGA